MEKPDRKYLGKEGPLGEFEVFFLLFLPLKKSCCHHGLIISPYEVILLCDLSRKSSEQETILKKLLVNIYIPKVSQTYILIPHRV